MTVVELLAATSDPAWMEMISRRRAHASGDQSLMTVDWGRKGGSHYKDGQFTKK